MVSSLAVCLKNNVNVPFCRKCQWEYMPVPTPLAKIDSFPAVTVL